MQKDIQLDALPAVTAGSADGCAKLYDTVCARYAATIDWYGVRRNTSKRAARGLRGLAIFLGALATVAPLALALVGQTDSQRWVPAATLLAALGATCVAFDRFFGFSTAWMRYIKAFFDLQARLQTLQYGYARERLKLRADAGAEELLPVFEMLFTADHERIEIVRAETEAWVGDFGKTLGESERLMESARAAAQATRALADEALQTGGIELEVEGLDKLEEHSFTLRVGATGIVRSGASSPLAIGGVKAGLHEVVLEGRAGGKPVSASALIKVSPNEKAAGKVVIA